jgi:uncharacterized membrane protein YhaH (DUF805 family)
MAENKTYSVVVQQRWPFVALMLVCIIFGFFQIVFALGLGLGCSESGQTMIGCYASSSYGNRIYPAAPGYNLCNTTIETVFWLTVLLVLVSIFALVWKRIRQTRVLCIGTVVLVLSATAWIPADLHLNQAPSRSWCAHYGYHDCQADYN